MADTVDLAQAHEERLRAQAVEAAVAAAKIGGDGAQDCQLCGDEIPPARRAANPGALTCIDCQQRLERAMGGR